MLDKSHEHADMHLATITTYLRNGKECMRLD